MALKRAGHGGGGVMACRHNNQYSPLYGCKVCTICNVPVNEQGPPPADAAPWQSAADKAIDACGARPGGHRWYMDYGAGGKVCLDCDARYRDVMTPSSPHSPPAPDTTAAVASTMGVSDS